MQENLKVSWKVEIGAEKAKLEVNLVAWVRVTLATALLDGNTSADVQNTFLMAHLSGLDACLWASKEDHR